MGLFIQNGYSIFVYKIDILNHGRKILIYYEINEIADFVSKFDGYGLWKSLWKVCITFCIFLSKVANYKFWLNCIG